MRIGVSIVLIGLLMLNCTSLSWVHLIFKVNQNYIASNWCEKKEVKNNHCQGKCQLNKVKNKITTEQSKDGNKEELSFNLFHTDYLYIPSLMEFRLPFAFETQTKTNRYTPALLFASISVLVPPPIIG